MEISNRIDVHHHVIPPAFVDAMEMRGIHEVAGAPLPTWRPEDSIDIMDMFGIQTAITSLSAPGVYFDDEAEACRLARECNEFSAKMREQYPERFGFFAVLPMPFTEHACKEAIYALEHLNADGIVLLGSTEGRFLGNPHFEELMAELNRRKAVVFVHPNLHQTSKTLDIEVPGFLVEFLCDTSRAAVNLIVSGTMERYPDIRWILAHAGGFLPYIAWRISLANLMPPFDQKAPQGMLHYIRRFYFDTALSPSPYALAALKELVDPSHILFGSDFPFAPKVVTGMQTQALDTSLILGASELEGIRRRHALALFPRLNTGNETIPSAPVYQRESVRNRLKRAAAKPVISLADRIRKR